VCPKAKQRQQVVFSTNWVPDNQKLSAGKIRNGRFLWHPIRTAVDFALVAEQKAIVRESERRELYAACCAKLECPVRQAACKL
jgi:hypothetical protein